VPIYLSASSGQTSEDVSFVFDELGSDANRKKIAVTRSDGTTECYVEIEKWDDANEKAWLHVKVHSISAIQDGYLYLYYDSDHADNDTYVGDVGSTPGQTVWDSYFKAVYHLGEDPSGGQYAVKDSTSNENHGTSAGTMLTEDLVDGQFGKCLEFDSSDDYVDCGSLPNIDDLTLKTIEACIDPEGWGEGSTGAVIAKGLTSIATQRGWTIYTHSGYSGIVFVQRMSGDDGFWSMPFTIGDMQHIAVSYDNGSLANNPLMYKDGDLQTATEENTPTGTITTEGGNNLSIGGTLGDYSSTFDSRIDEVRLSSVLRSAAWIKATYKGLFDDLLIFSTEQSSSSSSESESVSSSSESESVSISGSSSSSESASASTSSASGSVSLSSESTSQSSSSESVSNSSSGSESSESVSSESESVSASSSSSSHDPIVHANLMSLEITPLSPTYAGCFEATTMSLEFTTQTVTYPLYGRMGQPVIAASKPKAICEASKAYIDFEARSAKILMSGY